MTNTNQLPATIADMLAQLGGPRIFAMAFKTCAYSADAPDGAPCAAYLTLTIAPDLVKMTKGKATHVVVELGWDDVYTVKVIRQGKMSRRTFEIPAPVEIANVPMVYADTLRRTVEAETGLILAL